MNNKQSGVGVGSMNRDSPSPPPPTLCFSTRRSSNSGSGGDNKKQHRHHHHHYHPYDDPYQNIGLCGCRRTSKSRCVSAIGVMILLLTYSAMGSILFMSLESEEDMGKTVETAVAASKPRTDLVNADIRSRTVDRLWSITEDLNILYKENWTRLAAKEVQQFQDMLLRSVRATKIQQTGIQPSIKPHKWTYASALLYSITLITTIGYGGISIRTHTRIAALLYALFGIPLVLLYLSVMGDGLSTIMRCLFRRLLIGGTRRSRSESTSSQSSGNNSNSSSSTGIGTINGRTDNGSIVDKSFHNASLVASNSKAGKLTKANQNYDNNYSNQMNNYSYDQQSNGVLWMSIMILISIMILVCYITLGAALFHRIQTWNVLESLYFCFTSLGTIGFGELEPKGNVAQYVASAYILIGMAVVAMCFNLIRTEINMWLRRYDGGGDGGGEKSYASTISGPGNGRNVSAGISQNTFAHLMPPHHNHLMHQLQPSTGPIEDVALVTVAVTPKS